MSRAADQLGKIAKLFSCKKLPDMVSKSYLEPAGRPSDKWSLGNRLLVMMEGTRDARGILQWNAAGRRVVKGRKAIYILGPTVRSRDETDEKTGEERKVKYVAGFHAIPVFRYEDTCGAGLSTVKDEPKKLPPLADVAAKWGIRTRYDATEHGEYGSFSPSEGEIRLCTDDAATFFHELAHAAHSRLEELKSGQDPEQEAIAQLAACALGRAYGYNVDGYTYNYIAHYAGGNEPERVGRMCYRVLGKVERIMGMILEEERAAGRDAGKAESSGGPAPASGPADAPPAAAAAS